MALTAQELQVIISANATQFRNALAEVKQELKNVGDTAQTTSKITGGNLFGDILKANLATSIITSTVSKATSAMKGLFTQVLEGGSAYSRLKIATETVTNNLGITREELKKLRDDLAESNTYGINAENVIRTLALSGLVKMSKGLQAVDARSGETVKGVTALTLAMKDLSAASAIDSSVGIESLARFINSGMQTEQTQQMLAGIANLDMEYKAWGVQMGITGRQLTAVEQAQARMTLVMREADKVWGAYANTYQTSGKALGSIRDIVKSLAQQVGGNLEPVFRVATNAILQFFMSLRSFLGDSENSIGNWANKVAGYLVALIRLVGSLMMRLPVIGKYFANLANFTVKPIQATKGLSAQLNKNAGAVDNLGDSIDATGKKASELKDQLAGFDEMNVLNPQTSASSPADNNNPGFSAGGGAGDLGLADSSAEIMKYANQAEMSIKGLLEPVKAFLERLQEIKIFGKPITSIFADIAKYVGIAMLAFTALKPVLTPIVSILSPLWSILSAIGGAFSTLTLAGWGVFGVFAAIAGVVLYAYNSNEQFRNSVNETVGQVVAKVQELVGVFLQRMPEIQTALKPVTDFLSGVFKTTLDLLGGAVVWLWNNAIKPWIDNMLNNAVPNLNKFIDALIFAINIGTQVGNFIGQILTPVFNVLGDVFKAVWNGIASTLTFVWDGIIKPVFNGIGSFINGFIIPVVNNLALIWGIVFNTIGNIARSVFNSVYSVMKPVIDWIWTAIAPAVNFMRDRFTEAFNAISSVASTIWGGISWAFKSGINGIIDLINGFIKKVNGMITSVNNAGQSIPGWSQISFRVGEIPKLAMGGVVNKPTLLQAGEGGYRKL